MGPSTRQSMRVSPFASHADDGGSGEGWNGLRAKRGRTASTRAFHQSHGICAGRHITILKPLDRELADRWRLGIASWLKRTDPKRLADKRANRALRRLERDQTVN